MSISTYIKNNNILKELDFITAYSTIIELIKDERLEWEFDEVKNV